MKRINFNIKDRKTLSVLLCLILVCVFILTIAYATLSVTLNIVGNAEVVASSWNIKLANPKVTNGSVNNDVPTISGNTLSFNTTLNTPGDFYEFTVDVVNDGSIDAMISNVVKNPELTVEQAKYLKYEITYQNGESISNKQLLAKETIVSIKVRIEYRNDLVASNLPTTSTTLNLSLTLEYIQSDGTGTSVNNNGVAAKLVTANGDINEIGTIVTIGDQQFYTIGTEGDNVKLLSMYNLYVGNSVDMGYYVTPLASPTGKQDSTAIGYNRDTFDYTDIFPFIGTTVFSYKNSTYAGSVVEGYVNAYKDILEGEEYGIDVVEARLITKDELTSEDIGCSADEMTCTTSEHAWIYSTSYWSWDDFDTDFVWFVYSFGSFDFNNSYSDDFYFGVRPVIIISKSLF